MDDIRSITITIYYFQWEANNTRRSNYEEKTDDIHYADDLDYRLPDSIHALGARGRLKPFLS